jgi:uncharacterized protein (TIGR03067 family)
MSRRSPLDVAGLVLFATIAFGAKDDSTDRQRLQGSWTADSARRDGKEAADLHGHVLVFRGDTFTIRSKDETLYSGTYVLDASKMPRTIDFKHARGDLKGKVWRGIYQLEGETLKICDNAGDLAKERPTGFETRAGSGHVRILFKRSGR